MTHQILSIDDYLHETAELAKKNKLRKLVLSCTIFLSIITLGFGIYTSTDTNKNTQNQHNTPVLPVSEERETKFGEVFLAFDPDELDGIVDIESFLIEKERNEMRMKVNDAELHGHKASLNEVRNSIIIKGNYYAVH